MAMANGFNDSQDGAQGVGIDEGNVQDLFCQFLKRYGLDEDVGEDSQSASHYVQILTDDFLNKDSQTLEVDLGHLRDYNLALHDFIVDNYYAIEVYLRKAIQNVMAELSRENNTEEQDKEYYISMKNHSIVHGIRHLRADQVGQLHSFTGTVTRTSDVKPELYLGSFKCGECGVSSPPVPQEFIYTPPIICANPSCMNKKNWELHKEGSTFCNWQKVKVQENPDQIPAGSLPRSLDVILRNDLCERARPGDRIVFVGVVIVIPDVSQIQPVGERLKMSKNRSDREFANVEGIRGLKDLGVREMGYKLSVLASSAIPHGSDVGLGAMEREYMSQNEVFQSFTIEEQESIKNMGADQNIYQNLAMSLAPQVYGNEDIKKAILLMLMGGVHKQTKEGMNLRGDINMIIVGDPACGKSQLLKFVADFMPRTVYTSGKSSSAAGLTATVAKDSESGEFCIEAGALMLADNGVCCIDEFDKMDDKDQVAIHEAMEQQTISISKAGIHAKLNARTPVLAAANPISGKYDRSKPIRYNVNLTPAILSRFDLLYIMVDEPNEAVDYNIAQHLCKLHADMEANQNDVANDKYSKSEMQRYFKYAKSINPVVTEEAQQLLEHKYLQLRQEDVTPGQQSAYRITVRQLEALVRLSEAVARVHLCREVREPHVREATRLLRNSIIGLETPDLQLDDEDVVLPYEFQDPDLDLRRLNLHDEQVGQENAGNADDENMGADAGGDIDPDQENRPPVQDASGAQQQAKEGAPKKVTITQRKLNFIRHTLITILQQKEQEDQQSGESEEEQLVPNIGLSMQKLVEYYFAELNRRRTQFEFEEEYQIIVKAIKYLITRDGSLVVVSSPEKNVGESDEDFKQREAREKIIAANPNFVIDA